MTLCTFLEFNRQPSFADQGLDGSEETDLGSPTLTRFCKTVIAATIIKLSERASSGFSSCLECLSIKLVSNEPSIKSLCSINLFKNGWLDTNPPISIPRIAEFKYFSASLLDVP